MNSLQKWPALIFTFAMGLQLSSCDWGVTELEVSNWGPPGQLYGHPTWSPTGEWIAYEYYGIDSLYGIWFIRPDGRDAHFVTRGDLPDFSPDGQKLALGLSKQIFVYDLESRVRTQLTFDGSSFFPSWSPEGEKIAYDSNRDNPGGTFSIWFMDADGKNKKDLDAPEFTPWTTPDWFPDFRIIHQRGTRRNNGFTTDLFIVDTTGTFLNQLTNSGLTNGTPRVSPDGSKIVWERWDVENNNDIAVWMMNSDGSNKIRLTEGWEPAWSPDGRKIIYRKEGDYVINEPYDEDDPKIRGSLWIINIETQNHWQFLPVL